MNEAVLNTILKFLSANGGWLLGGLALIVAFGMALGAMKKLAAQAFVSSLSTGDSLATALINKPKGVVLMVVLGGVAAPAYLLGFARSPERIVRVPVAEKVPYEDTSKIDAMAEQVRQAQASEAQANQARAEAEQATQFALANQREAEGNLNPVINQRDAAIRERDAARQEIARLEAKVKEMTPGAKPDPEEYSALAEQMDVQHMLSLTDELHVYGFNPRRHVSHTHKEPRQSGFDVEMPQSYHRDCAKCDLQRRTRDAINDWKRRDYAWQRQHPQETGSRR